MVSQGNANYPADVEVEFPENPSRLMALLEAVFLLKALLLIPHMIILYFLGIVASIVLYLGYWAVLITGRYPRSFFNFGVGVQRWGFRANAWMAGWTGRYPPFSLS